MHLAVFEIEVSCILTEHIIILLPFFVRPILQNKLFLKYYMNLDDLGIYIIYLADIFWIKMIYKLSAYWSHYDIETTYYPIFISYDLILTITNCVGIAKEWLAIKSLLVTVPNYKHKNYWHTLHVTLVIKQK